jgi:pimeloyl-ACP methyl ester carboxylesterase
MFFPTQILWIWLRGILALALIGLGISLLAEWYQRRERIVEEPAPVVAQDAPNPPVRTRVERWQFGWNRETALLLGGFALLLWSFGGGMSIYPRLFRRVEREGPHAEPNATKQRLRMPDGSEIVMESTGPAGGEVVLLTHGWGLDRNEWHYARRELGERVRLVTWDLPGIRESDRPTDRDWSLEKLAACLHVVTTAIGEPVVLMGHSIGVMISLTYCKLHPELLGTRVRGLILAHGTYTNPVRTTNHAWLYAALQKPVLEPLCHLMIWLSPLVRIMNWLSYLNGSAHRQSEWSSFCGNETRQQLDYVALRYSIAAPDVMAHGMLGMFRYDVTATLSSIRVPVLVVAGDRDATCLPEASRYMAATIPNARLVTLHPAKHCGLLEHHSDLHAHVLDFLTSLPASANVERIVHASNAPANVVRGDV